MISSAPTNQPQVQKRTPLDCQRILQSDNRYNDEKSVILHNKQKQLAKASDCKSTINVGELCLKIECLIIPFNGQRAVVQSIFCCPKKQFTMRILPWVQLKPVTQIVVNEDAEATEKMKVLRNSDLN